MFFDGWPKYDGSGASWGFMAKQRRKVEMGHKIIEGLKEDEKRIAANVVRSLNKNA